MSPRIAVVQFRITHLDSRENFRRMEGFIRRAVARRAQVVVFPEDCVTGSIFGDLTKLDTTHTAREAFRALAKTYCVDIVTGSCMEGTPEGNFNTSYYIDAYGEVRGTYRKNHLHPSEYAFLKPGTDAPIFETAYGKAGIVICWDMLFPEIFQCMKAQGVQLVYCPSYWYREVGDALARRHRLSEERQLDALCIARSLEANAALVYANAAGVQHYANGTRDTLIGHSQVVMPGLGALQRLNHHREGMVVQEVDLDVLASAQRVYHA